MAGRCTSSPHPYLSPLPPPLLQAEKTLRKAGLADRLINGLSGENARWGTEIQRMVAVEGKLVGDVLMASAFVSYAAPFNMLFRQSLLTEKWIPDLIERAIPMSQVGGQQHICGERMLGGENVGGIFRRDL